MSKETMLMNMGKESGDCLMLLLIHVRYPGVETILRFEFSSDIHVNVLLKLHSAFLTFRVQNMFVKYMRGGCYIKSG